MRKRGKRGQITLFIVIGIILLFAVSIGYYIISHNQESQLIGGRRLYESVPVELQPQNSYIEDCVIKTTEDAISLFGVQGGYINLSDAGFVSVKSLPESTNAISFFDNTVPYWWHMKGQKCTSGCVFENNMPSLMGENRFSAKNQIKRYIDENLNTCLRGFYSFRQQGFSVTNKTGVDSEVIITKDEVQVSVSYELEFGNSQGKHTLNRFYAVVPVQMYGVMDAARKIIEAEQNFTFLERQTVNMVSIYSGVGKKLPPIAETDFSPASSVYYLKSETKDYIEMLLESNIPALQVINSSNAVYRQYTDPIAEGLIKKNNLYLGDYKNYSIKFYYLDYWPIYLDITGRGVSGEFIGPEYVLSETFSWVGVKRYNYYYDISYPVLVEIYDQSAMNGKGFRLLFALEANVINNAPANTSGLNFATEKDQYGSLLCDYNQRNSGLVNVTVVDAKTQLPLDDARVTYACGIEECGVGVTQSGSVTAKLPVCLGGYLRAVKPEYLTGNAEFSAKLDKNDSAAIILSPIITINASVRKLNYVRDIRGGHEMRDEETALRKNEQAVISYERVQQSPADPEFSGAFVYSGMDTVKEITLVPGTYSVEITLLYNLPTPYGQTAVIIPEEVQDGVTLPEVVFNETFPMGGSELDNTTGYFVVDPAALYSSSRITFITIANPGFGVAENLLTYADLEEMNKNEELSLKYRSRIEPRLEP